MEIWVLIWVRIKRTGNILKRIGIALDIFGPHHFLYFVHTGLGELRFSTPRHDSDIGQHCDILISDVPWGLLYYGFRIHWPPRLWYWQVAFPKPSRRPLQPLSYRRMKWPCSRRFWEICVVIKSCPTEAQSSCCAWHVRSTQCCWQIGNCSARWTVFLLLMSIIDRRSDFVYSSFVAMFVLHSGMGTSVQQWSIGFLN